MIRSGDPADEPSVLLATTRARIPSLGQACIWAAIVPICSTPLPMRMYGACVDTSVVPGPSLRLNSLPISTIKKILSPAAQARDTALDNLGIVTVAPEGALQVESTP